MKIARGILQHDDCQDVTMLFLKFIDYILLISVGVPNEVLRQIKILLCLDLCFCVLLRIK